MRANRFLPVRSSVRPGDLLQSAGAARPGDMEPSGVQGPGGIYCCNQSIQFHCYWGEPRWNTCTNGKRNSVEALAPSSAIELGRIPDAYGGGVARRGHKLPTQHRPSLRGRGSIQSPLSRTQFHRKCKDPQTPVETSELYVAVLPLCCGE